MISPSKNSGGVNADFLFSVGAGLIRNYSRVAALGHNPDVDSGSLPEDVWTGGGVYPWMTASTSLEIVSTNVNDTSAGTGARTVIVTGLDINFITVTQTVTLNGTTPVALPSAMYRINSALIASAGSGKTNAGDLNIRSVSGATIRAIIPAGIGITRQSAYTVPAGRTLQIMSQYIAVTGGGSTRTADVATMFQSPNGFYRLPLILTASDGKPYRHDGNPGVIVTEKTDFVYRCVNVSNDNSSVVAAWLGVLRVN